jgi:CcmD family protein
VSYLVACYALVFASVGAYAAWLARERKRLARELSAQPGTNRG